MHPDKILQEMDTALAEGDIEYMSYLAVAYGPAVETLALQADGHCGPGFGNKIRARYYSLSTWGEPLEA